MNELHILNVGRADCIVMLLDTAQGRKCIVMDAGSCTYNGKTPLRTFLQRKGVREVDLAILTHLHQDHFGGFLQLVDQIPIKRFATPCGDLVFDERVYPIFGDREFFREYHQIFTFLEACGTELCFPEQYAGKTFRFGTCELQCLYTKTTDEMESVRCAKQLCCPDASDAEIVERLERHKRACNGDSSIWVLRQGETVVALLGGDSTDQTMQAALDSTKPFHPIVQKLSHHGIGDSYFSVETQKRLAPSTLVISVDRAHCSKTEQEQADALCRVGASKRFYTYEGDFSFCYRTVDQGDLKV